MTKEKQEHLILQIKYAFLALIVGICVGIVAVSYTHLTLPTKRIV